MMKIVRFVWRRLILCNLGIHAWQWYHGLWQADADQACCRALGLLAVWRER